VNILFIGNGTVGENIALTGSDTRFLEVAKAWKREGHEIHLLASESGCNMCKKFGLDFTPHIFSVSTFSNRIGIILFALKTLFLPLPKSLQGFKPTIVYSNNEMLFDIFPALKLKLRYRDKIKWAVLVHIMPPVPWKRKQSTLLNSTLFFINERVSFWLANFFADILLPVSKNTERKMREVGANMKKAHSVECGANCSEIRNITENVKGKKYDAVFMKRLQVAKGIFDLIDIWEKVVKSKPDASLLIIGDGNDGEKAKEIVRAKKLEANIEFAGPITDTKLKFEKLAESKMFIHPSYEENWAIVVGEAMAAGVPVLAYDLEDLLEVWEDYFIQIPLGNKDYFAKKIIELLNSPAELKIISQKALVFVIKYDWSIVAKREIDIILKKFKYA
jgi:glycosyltransferase involved in cell wall biosynthesis